MANLPGPELKRTASTLYYKASLAESQGFHILSPPETTIFIDKTGKK